MEIAASHFYFAFRPGKCRLLESGVVASYRRYRPQVGLHQKTGQDKYACLGAFSAIFGSHGSARILGLVKGSFLSVSGANFVLALMTTTKPLNEIWFLRYDSDD